MTVKALSVGVAIKARLMYQHWLTQPSCLWATSMSGLVTPVWFVGVGCKGSTIPAKLSNPTDVMAGKFYSCAMDDTGVVCWGRNYKKQMLFLTLATQRLLAA